MESNKLKLFEVQIELDLNKGTRYKSVRLHTKVVKVVGFSEEEANARFWQKVHEKKIVRHESILSIKITRLQWET